MCWGRGLVEPLALQAFLRLHRAPTSPCPAGHRGRRPSSDRTKWESETIPGGPALDREESARAKQSQGCGDRPPTALQSRAGPARGPSGGSGSGSWHSSAPALRFRLSSSPSPAARRSLHPASLSLPALAHLGTGNPPWRRRLGPARLKHLSGATRLVATALSAVVRSCRVGCDFGRTSGCGSLLPPARGLESGDPLSEGEEGEPGAPGDPEVPAPLPRGR